MSMPSPRAEMRQAAAELMAVRRWRRTCGDLVEDAGPLEVNWRLRCCTRRALLVAADSAHGWWAGFKKIAEIVALGVKHRGPHDELHGPLAGRASGSTS